MKTLIKCAHIIKQKQYTFSEGSIRNKLVLVPLKTHAQSLNMFH